MKTERMATASQLFFRPYVWVIKYSLLVFIENNDGDHSRP